MRINKFLIVMIISLLCVGGVVAQSTKSQILSVEEMFVLADMNNHKIKAHSASVDQSLADIKVAKNAYLPSIETELSFSYNGDGVVLNRDFGYEAKADIPHFGNNFIIEVSQVVYAGGAIKSGVKMMELKSQLASLNAESNRQQVRFLIVGNYLELCKIENQIQVIDGNITQTEKVIENMRKRYEQGTVLLNDITRYELKLQDLNYMRIKLLNTKKIVNNQLVSALGLPYDVEIVPNITTNSQQLVENKDYWVDLALNSSPSLKTTDIALQMNKQQEKITKSERIPQIALFARNQLNGPITIEIPAIDRNFNYWAVGIGVRYNIGNLYKSGRKLDANKCAIRQAEEQKQEMEEHTRLAINSAYIHYNEAFLLCETKEKSVELARQNFDVVNYRYESDLALLTDLLDASTQKLDSELQLVNAQINILYNYYKLKYISGTL